MINKWVKKALFMILAITGISTKLFANDKNTCISCFQHMEKAEKQYLPCGHDFHKTCLSEAWFQNYQQCPICRHKVTEPINIKDTIPGLLYLYFGEKKEALLQKTKELATQNISLAIYVLEIKTKEFIKEIRHEVEYYLETAHLSYESNKTEPLIQKFIKKLYKLRLILEKQLHHTIQKDEDYKFSSICDNLTRQESDMPNAFTIKLLDQKNVKSLKSLCCLL